MNGAQLFIVLDAVDAVEETYVIAASVFGNATVSILCVRSAEGEDYLFGKENGKILIRDVAKGVGHSWKVVGAGN